MTELKRCPCGQVPEYLDITPSASGYKWAVITPNCCGQWDSEIKVQGLPLDSDDVHGYAIETWNELPRGGMKDVA